MKNAPEKRDLHGMKILITAGPTWVPVDSVRVLSNIFTGRLGVAIASAASRRGAVVTLLLGPVPGSVDGNIGRKVRLIRFRFFSELEKLLEEEVSRGGYDAVIHSAAVSDFEVLRPFKGKISSRRENLVLRLKPTPKLVNRIKKLDPNTILVKFKLEVGKSHEKLLSSARDSMRVSDADVLVANDLSFIGDEHQAYVMDRNGGCQFCEDREQIARVVLDTVCVMRKVRSCSGQSRVGSASS